MVVQESILHVKENRLSMGQRTTSCHHPLAFLFKILSSRTSQNILAQINNDLKTFCFLENVEPKDVKDGKSRKIQKIENCEEMQQRREVGVVVFGALAITILGDETEWLTKEKRWKNDIK